MTTHRPTRSHWPTTLSYTTLTALAITTGALLNTTHTPPPAEPAIAHHFADAVRADITTLDPALTPTQIEDEATTICDNLTHRPLPDVYYTHEVPARTNEDAVRFFALAVAWKCPQHMAGLAELRTP